MNGVAVYMPTELYGVQIKFLIDTGASVTVLSRAMYEQIPRERRPELTTPSTQTRLEVADQSYLSVDGIALISLQAGGMSFEWHVYVAPICDEGLLGMDFLYAHEYLMGLHGLLELNGRPVKTEVGGGGGTTNQVRRKPGSRCGCACLLRVHCGWSSQV